MSLPHLPTSANFHQDIILHIQEDHQWRVRLMHSLIPVSYTHLDLSCATQIDFPPTSQISEIKQLNKVMQDTMGVVRNENTLLNGIQTVQALTGNLPLLGMAVLKSALACQQGDFRL